MLKFEDLRTVVMFEMLKDWHVFIELLAWFGFMHAFVFYFLFVWFLIFSIINFILFYLRAVY